MRVLSASRATPPRKSSARSEGEGRGTTIVVKLPVVDQGEATHQAELQNEQVSAAGQLQRVLVVDDNADAADTVAMMLLLERHQVQVAYDGVSGIDLAEQFSPDVAILDLGLPGMDGLEMARRLRGVRALRRLKLFALTGNGQELDMTAAREAGFDHHLTKPAKAEDLSRLLVV